MNWDKFKDFFRQVFGHEFENTEEDRKNAKLIIKVFYVMLIEMQKPIDINSTTCKIKKSNDDLIGVIHEKRLF